MEKISIAQYALEKGVTVQSVRAQCAKGNVQGAEKDAHGQWEIPADTVLPENKQKQKLQSLCWGPAQVTRQRELLSQLMGKKTASVAP